MAFVQVRSARAWQRFVRFAMGSAGGLIAVATFFISYRLATQMAVALVMASVIASTVHSVMGLLEGDRSARYNLMGFGAMYLAGGVQALSKFGVLPSTPLTNFDLVQASSLVEALLVTCGLALSFAGGQAGPASAALGGGLSGAAHSRIEPEPAAQLDRLCAVFDGLSLHKILDREIDRAAALGRPMAVALVDLDRFRRFNEVHGHAAGDRHLQAVAEEIKRLLPRQGDSVARCGGEEFCVVMPDTSLQGAMLVCERIRVGLAAIGADERGPGGGVTASLGLVSLVPESGADHARVLQRASDALLRAKREGRNRCCRAA
jgi:diguanylate cyclase (GGDEF)-like protein